MSDETTFCPDCAIERGGFSTGTEKCMDHKVADTISSLRLALETATREAEEERRTAEAAVKFLGRIAEVTWEAGLPSGDREQTLKNVRALVSRPAPPADAAREAAIEEARKALAYRGNMETRAKWLSTALRSLLAALSTPAPAPSQQHLDDEGERMTAQAFSTHALRRCEVKP